MVQGPEAASGHDKGAGLDPGQQVGEEQVPPQGNQDAPDFFNDKPFVSRRHDAVLLQDEFRLHLCAFHCSGEVWRGRMLEAVRDVLPDAGG